MKKQLLLIIYLSVVSIVQAQVSKTLTVSNPGTLGSLLTVTEKTTVQTLTLIGTIDARDFMIMRDSMPVLTEIDIKGTTIAAFNGTGGTDYPESAIYQADAIPQFAYTKKFYYPLSSYPSYIYKQITSIILPESINAIGKYAFNSYKLKTIVIPLSVKTIESHAFYGCSKVSPLFIPSSVNFIGTLALSGCNITIDSQNPYFSYVDSVLYNKDHTTVLQSFSMSKNVVIPSTVTTIGEYAFMDRPFFSITIPSSVTTIGNGAFSDAYNLKSVTIPSSVTTIGDNTFIYCMALQSVDLPSAVTSIGDNAFFQCGLKSIIIPESVTSIGKHAFQMSRLESTILPASLKTIGDSAFFSCNSLKKVSIPQNASLTSFGNSAFEQCSLIDSITIPSSVISIGDSAFSGCSISSISFPSTLTSIGKKAFSSCKIDSVFIPSSVSYLGERAFCACPLKALTLSSSIKFIGEFTFWGFIGQSPIYLPASVDSISNYAFTPGCNLIIDPLNKKFVSIDNVVYNNDTTIVVSCSASKKGDYVMPSSVKSINNYAFSSCYGIKSVTLSSQLTTIGGCAFSNDTLISSIVIPQSVTSIGLVAFSNCKALSSITLPSSLISIGDMAFENDSLINSVVIPSSVLEIGQEAFDSKTSYTVNSENPNYTSIDGVLYNKDKSTLIKYPSTKKGDYVIPSTVKKITRAAFRDCKGLTSVTIPALVDSIEDYAFSYCNNLKSIIALNPTPAFLPPNPNDDVNLSNIYLFYNVSFQKCILYVPVGSKAAYKKELTWHLFSNIIEGTGNSIMLSDSIVSIENKAVATKTIQITTINSWTAHSLASWLTVLPSSGTGTQTFVLVADSNTSSATRMTMVNVVANDTSVAPRTIMVVQKGNTKTAIAELNNDALQVYPNPASNSFSIQNTEQSIVSIYSITGALLKTHTVQAGDAVSITDLSAGLYFVKIQIGENSVTRSLHILR